MEFQKNIHLWERLASIAAGSAIAIYQAQGKRRPFALGVGAALVARGVSGYCPVNDALARGRNIDDTREVLGGSRGIKLEESVTIRRSALELYNLWRPLADLPKVMRHLESVEVLGNHKSHWVMRGPAGIRFEWDAEIINDVKPELIAWRSLPGAEVVSAGSVKFRERQRRGGLATEVTVTLQYEPIGGKAASVLAWFAGQSPASILREDLRRFKAGLEAREVPTIDGRSHGTRSAIAKLAGVDQ